MSFEAVRSRSLDETTTDRERIELLGGDLQQAVARLDDDYSGSYPLVISWLEALDDEAITIVREQLDTAHHDEVMDQPQV